PFYNLPYLIAQLLGIGLYARYEEDRPRFRQRFDEALAMTGAGSFSMFVDHLELGVSGIELWQAGFGVIARDIDRYEALVRQASGNLAAPPHGFQNGPSV
ncbi:MAG TPA: hypothetical protein VD789_04315, partial [Thermomicrobiales bacterium]|nr:hypothetical protein [Thermomicrobiales bacterium]